MTVLLSWMSGLLRMRNSRWFERRMLDISLFTRRLFDLCAFCSGSGATPILRFCRRMPPHGRLLNLVTKGPSGSHKSWRVRRQGVFMGIQMNHAFDQNSVRLSARGGVFESLRADKKI